jgi:iron-sulfur cluster repair protein YtfE (RIC family)
MTDKKPIDRPLTALTLEIESNFHAQAPGLIVSLRQNIENSLSQTDMQPLAHQLTALCTLIESHIFNEKESLFPLIRDLEKSDEYSIFICEDIARPISAIIEDHHNIIEKIAEIDKIINELNDDINIASILLSALNLAFFASVHREENELFPLAIERHHWMRDNSPA